MSAPILTILRNGETLKQQSIEGEVSLGRAEGCAIRLEDRAVSRQHAVFRATTDGVQIERKSEFGPVVVNGAECTTAIVKEGDVVSIGPYLMRVSIPKPKEAPPPPQPEPSVPEASVPGPAPEAPSATDTAAQDALGVSGGEPVPGMDGALPALETPADGAVPAEGSAAEPAPSLEVEEVQAQAPAIEASDPEGIDEDAKTKLTPVAKLSVKLIFPEGQTTQPEYELTKDEVSIGRGKNCDIVLVNDKKSSRKHAIIRRAGLSFVIKDLDSANGTYVNGVRVQEQELAGEDTIRIGDVEFQFRALSADYEARQKDFMPVSDEPEPAPEAAAADAGALQPVDGGAPAGAVSDPSLIQGAAIPGAGDLGGVPGIGGIPGTGGAVDTSKMSLVDKIKNFKHLPKKQKMIIGGLGLALAFLLLSEDEPQKQKGPAKKGATATTGAQPQGPMSFERLTPEQQRFVEAQHALGFDHYKNRDYDKALYEIRKIFTLIPDYKDSKEIERYALEGKRKVDALEDEKRKREEEKRLKEKIAALVEETSGHMKKKAYEQAKEMFGQVLAIDPDNVMVATWQKEIAEYEEDIRRRQKEKEIAEEIKKTQWSILKEADAERKAGKCHTAPETYQRAADVNPQETEVVDKAKAGIRACRAYIAGRRDPVLAEAKSAEEAKEYAKAFQLFKRATRIDPPHPAGYAGMARVRGILHDKAKGIYTEAILAESFSDYATAVKKYEEVAAVAPEDDIYHQRAKRKLGLYFIGRGTGSEGGGP